MKRALITGLFVAVWTGSIAGQTRVDLGSQSKNINFSSATSVQLLPTGATLPATCSAGNLFFLTASPAGMYQCVAANTWSAAGNTLIDVRRTSSTVLTVGSTCSAMVPCNYRIGSVVYGMTAPSTVTVNGGQGEAYVYLDRNGNLSAGAPQDGGNLTLGCAGCVVVSPVSQYPAGSIPIARWHATGGAWDAAGSDDRSLLSTESGINAGTNITLTEAGGSVIISASAGSVTTSSSGGGSGIAGAYFNPTDPTQWYRDHLSLANGLVNGGDGWSFTAGCAPSGGTSASPFSSQSVVTAAWAMAAAGATCLMYFPTAGNSTYGWGTYDYWSGAAPAKLWVSAVYTTPDSNGTHYVGLGSTTGIASVGDFIGCRQIGGGHWFAVIRSGGVDVAVADTGFAHDTGTHRVVVDNNGGTANTIRCTVDGNSSGLALGTVPTEPTGWTYLFGATAGAASTTFAPFQYTIFLQGLPRL